MKNQQALAALLTVTVPSMRRQAKEVVNRLARPIGARVVMDWEAEATHARYWEVVNDLEATYRRYVFPGMGTTRDGRVDLLCQLIGTSPSEALHLIGWLRESLTGAGDVCEMGVAQGATSALIANELDDQELWLYDSFEGLSAPTAKDGLIDDFWRLGSMDRYEATMAFPVQEVRNRLDHIGFPAERTHIVPGFIAPDAPVPEVVAFAYLDFDLYEPILTGLRLLHPRTRTGSSLMVDDYRYFSSGVEAAVDEFLADTGCYELVLPPETAGRFCMLRRR